MTEALTQVERTRRAELNADTRLALEAGLSLAEFLSLREASISGWCEWLHAEMDRTRAADPTEILPQLATAIEARCTSEARKIAEATARSVVAQMLRKAIA